MDKKSIIGLVLIGLILSVFTIVNQPTPEEKARFVAFVNAAITYNNNN